MGRILLSNSFQNSRAKLTFLLLLVEVHHNLPKIAVS